MKSQDVFQAEFTSEENNLDRAIFYFLNSDSRDLFRPGPNCLDVKEV